MKVFYHRMKLFAGPCLLESEEDAFLVPKTITENLPEGVDYYFKASFDNKPIQS